MIKFNFSILVLLYTLTICVHAVEPLPKNLIDFSGEIGPDLVKESLNENLLKLLSNYTIQKTTSYCGVASAVMVLNSTNITPPLDAKHAPYHYFTQDNFFNEQVEKIIKPDTVLKQGMTLTQLAQALQSHGLKTTIIFANKISVNEFREKLINALKNEKFIIINFLRSALQQQGGGHHSPIAAYDQKTDRFLIIEPARYKYPAYWAKTQDLWHAANTLDKSESRGVIVISD